MKLSPNEGLFLITRHPSYFSYAPFMINQGILFLFLHAAPTTEEAACAADVQETTPAKVNISEVLNDMMALKDKAGRSLISKMNPELERAIRDLFERDPKTISKLEQFYGLLFHLAKHKSIDDPTVHFDIQTVRKLLISSKVFSVPEVPNRMTEVSVFWTSYHKRATYEVKFDQKEFRMPLNKGKGFSNFREGLCQTAKEVVFYGGFKVNVSMTRDNHVYVDEFKSVDLYGDFGARGVVDVDINYVTVKSVEFLNGSPLGIVRAKVAKREFETNEHSWLLRLVATLVTDKSTQPIDW